MFDSYKIFEKYPELKDEPEPIQVNVGRALQELLKRTINSAWGGGETRAETVDYEGYPVEECSCSKYEFEYMSVLKRIEKHPSTLKMNYDELPEDVIKDFEAKADYLLKKMKEDNFDCRIDIDKFLNEVFELGFGMHPKWTRNEIPNEFKKYSTEINELILLGFRNDIIKNIPTKWIKATTFLLNELPENHKIRQIPLPQAGTWIHKKVRPILERVGITFRKESNSSWELKRDS